MPEDDNVRRMKYTDLPLSMVPMMRALDRLSAAQKEQAVSVATHFGWSNTRGFRILLELHSHYREMYDHGDTADEQRAVEEWNDKLQRSHVVCARLPRDAVRRFNERMAKFDDLYGHHHATHNVLMAAMQDGAPRAAIETILDLGPWLSATEEEDKVIRDVITEVLAIHEIDITTKNEVDLAIYLELLDVIANWYT